MLVRFEQIKTLPCCCYINLLLIGCDSMEWQHGIERAVLQISMGRVIGIAYGQFGRLAVAFCAPAPALFTILPVIILKSQLLSSLDIFSSIPAPIGSIRG